MKAPNEQPGRVDAPKPNDEDALTVGCCPELSEDAACDRLDFHYRLLHPTRVTHNNRRVTVEVLIHARFERCPGPLALGDLVYSTTLMPGETVRLFTTDRRTRFSFDSSSQLSYRSEQTSEERFYMSSVNDFMSDIESRDESRGGTTAKGSTQGKAKASGALESFFAGPSVSVSGSYSAETTSEFMRELSQHARSSHHRSEEATRTANSTSIGEVQSRSHAEGETEDHFESASRSFSNPNKCHAITYYFYQINKTQTVRFTVESIQRRVIDDAANSSVTNRTFATRGDIGVVQNDVIATQKDRLEIEEIGRLSAARERQEADFTPGLAGNRVAVAAQPRVFVAAVQVDPMPAEVREAAMKEVDERLAATGLIAAPGADISEETRRRFSFESQSSIPTPGMLVRGCLDDCNICEQEVQEDIRLDLTHKWLKNEMLKKQIELLGQSAEYRCCPDGEVEDA
jgi:hypothetical protein